jgi:hypothetical protein
MTRRTAVVHVRLSVHERAAVRRAARSDARSVSAWVRSRILDGVRCAPDEPDQRQGGLFAPRPPRRP